MRNKECPGHQLPRREFAKERWFNIAFCDRGTKPFTFVGFSHATQTTTVLFSFCQFITLWWCVLLHPNFVVSQWVHHTQNVFHHVSSRWVTTSIMMLTMGHHTHRSTCDQNVDVATTRHAIIAAFTLSRSGTSMSGCVTNCSNHPPPSYSGAKVVFMYVPFLDCGLPYVHFAIFVTPI